MTFVLSGRVAGEWPCAKVFSELSGSPNLLEFKGLFEEDGRLGMLNDTEGSYLLVYSESNALMVAILTSGPFDLFPIRQVSPLQVCDHAGELVVDAFGRQDKVEIRDGVLRVGLAQPRMVFRKRVMPQSLLRLHGGSI